MVVKAGPELVVVVGVINVDEGRKDEDWGLGVEVTMIELDRLLLAELDPGVDETEAVKDTEPDVLLLDTTVWEVDELNTELEVLLLVGLSVVDDDNTELLDAELLERIVCEEDIDDETCKLDVLLIVAVVEVDVLLTRVDVADETVLEDTDAEVDTVACAQRFIRSGPPHH